jgi:hypothetical protein
MADSRAWGTGPGTRAAFTILPVAARLAAFPPNNGLGNGGEVRC